MTYALAPNGIFWSIQGEGHLTGLPMVFVRLAGCSVGCAECDTDYSVSARLTANEIATRCEELTSGIRDPWAWITGGEPTDHDLLSLISALKSRGFSVAVATSGVRKVLPPVDWLSVSPHRSCCITHSKLAQSFGNEVKLVPGLNGLDPFRWIQQNPDSATDFWFRYLQPLAGNERSKSLCLAFVREHPNWGLTLQSHKVWGLP